MTQTDIDRIKSHAADMELLAQALETASVGIDVDVAAKDIRKWSTDLPAAIAEIERLKEQLEQIREPKSVADRCFDYAQADDEAFSLVQKSLGGMDAEQCLEPGFKWHVVNSWTDYYDGSIEVVLPPDVPPMTREQADTILALGFCRIYESQGERGTLWGKTGNGSSCSPRKTDSDRQDAFRVKAELAHLKSQLEQAKAFRQISRGLET